MNLSGNWSYPTAIRFGAGRISELAEACAQAGIARPLLVTDRGLAGLPITAQALDLMDEAGVGKRMNAEGLLHGGFEMLFKGERHHRINMNHLTGGKNVMVYGHTEVTRDLMDARQAAGLTTAYEAGDVTVHDLATAPPACATKKTVRRMK